MSNTIYIKKFIAFSSRILLLKLIQYYYVALYLLLTDF